MQSIGERLEEARKRRGISIREASEATKIRGDFLLQFENNQYEVGLPDIYVRGFLRNYAGFLKIDPEKIVTDFNAALLGEARSQRRDARELFGRMELPERPKSNKPQGSDQPAGDTAGAAGARRRGDDQVETTREPIGPDLGLYARIGGIIVAGVLAILLIVLLLKSLIGSGEPPPTDPTQQTTPATSTGAQDQQEITLIALEDIAYVKVTQESDNAVLFNGRIARGERVPIRRNGRVLVDYSEGRNLRIEIKGQQYQVSTVGIGKSYVD